MAKHHVYGIDLGSYEIKVYDLEKDNIWTEKNVVAVDSSGALLAVFEEAEQVNDDLTLVYDSSDDEEFY